MGNQKKMLSLKFNTRVVDCNLPSCIKILRTGGFPCQLSILHFMVNGQRAISCIGEIRPWKCYQAVGQSDVVQMMPTYA